MLRSNGIKKNYFYYLLSQVANILLGVAIIPYLARTLGVKGIGSVAYVNVISQYFTLLATLGMLNYGTRTLGYYSSLQFSERIVFSNLAFIQGVTTIISVLLYCLFIYFVFPDNGYLFYISVISIAAVGIDYSWYFIGTGQMKKFAIRNLLFKIITLVLIFWLVKHKKDIGLYIFLNSISILSANGIILLYLPKSFRKLQFSKKVIMKHLWPCLTLFVPQFLTLIYLNFDKVLLGSLLDKFYLGIYDSSGKIIQALGSITVSLSPIMVSKISGLLRNQNFALIKEYCKKSLLFTIYISTPLCFGLTAISSNFVPWFFGNSFGPAIQTLIILSPAIIFTGTSDVFVNQLMLSLRMDKQLYIIIFSMIILNVTLNLFLIPQFSNVGAAYANILSHFVVLFIELYLLRKIITIKPLIKDIIAILLSGAGMFFIINILKAWNHSPLNLFIEIFIGFTSYLLFSFIFRSIVQTDILNYISKVVQRKLA